MTLRGTRRPISSIAARNASRSSARRIAAMSAPIVSTSQRSRTPASSSSVARFKAVWPPSVGSSASGRSVSMMRVRVATSSGSTYVRVAMSGSVMIVAGFELTSTTSYPSSRRTLQACVPE